MFTGKSTSVRKRESHTLVCVVAFAILLYVIWFFFYRGRVSLSFPANAFLLVELFGRDFFSNPRSVCYTTRILFEFS